MNRRFYDALKDALDAIGWSIPTLCREAGVSTTQITKFMQRGAKGERISTNVDDAAKIANALGLTLDEMLGDDTARLRSEAASLWRQLTDGEREILLAAARGQRVREDTPLTQSNASDLPATQDDLDPAPDTSTRTILEQ